MIKVERNVPLEPPRNRTTYPYRQLEVGESFFVPGAIHATIATQAWRWGKRLERKYETRKRPGGVRVWRTA